MENIVLDFFQNQEFDSYVKECIKPIVNMIYNEIYTYIWFVCFFNVFLIFIALANLIILLKLNNKIT